MQEHFSTCLHCRREFPTTGRKNFSPSRKYCSRACYNAARATQPRNPSAVFVPCLQCGENFRVPRCRADEAKYCSMRCKGLAMRGGHPANYQGFYQTAQGYIYVQMPDHPASGVKGYVAAHRLVAEVMLGRYLTADEVVHHIDGNPANNKQSNLSVMDRREHGLIHQSGRPWSRSHLCCVTCGTTERKHMAQGMCDPCYKRHRYHLSH